MPGSISSPAHDPGNRAADDPREDREDQIERADVLVVGRHEPADEEARLVVGVVVRVVRLVRPSSGAASAVVLMMGLASLLILGGRGLVGRGLLDCGWRRRAALRRPRPAAIRCAGRGRLGARHRAALRGDPGANCAGGTDLDRDRHVAVARAAKLGALAEIDARPVDLGPGLVELAGVGVLLDPEGRDARSCG